MAVPLKYNFRHIVRRWRTTGMTVLAISLVVAMFICIQSLGQGLSEAFKSSGSDLNVLILRRGSTAETNSTIDRDQYSTLLYMPGIATDAGGKPIAAGECINIVVRPKLDGGETSAMVRGTMPRGPELRPVFKLNEGRMFEPGKRELIVGEAAAKRFANSKVGDRIKLVKSEWTIVGKFEAGRTAFESELWGDADELNSEFERTVYSSMLLRVNSAEDRDALVARIKDDKRLSSLNPQLETAYYAEQTKSALPIQFLGVFLSVVMSVGAVFAAMNTMYASVSSRSWEIATLRVLGFSRFSIMVSFVIESIVLAVLGGAIGALLAMPMNGVATGTSNMMTFSEVAFAFRITPGLVLTGLAFAAMMGLFGGLLPALQASRKPIVQSLRES